MMKGVIIYSGGMDSFTLLNDIRQQHDVHALSFNYGQRHVKELQYATRFCAEENIPHQVVDMREIGSVLLAGSSLTSDIAVPEGHYEEESMKLTVVPNRNMIMLSLAIGYAVSIEAAGVYIGAHSGDHAIYPDCRPEFIAAMNSVSFIANWRPMPVYAPYIDKDKGDIAAIGKALGIDYGKAWTCYNGRDKACGKCGACQERIEAMAKAGIADPMEYEA
jgi:7-cyano-7-deazaguanine synthase